MGVVHPPVSNQLHLHMQHSPFQQEFDLIHLFSGEVPKAELTPSFCISNSFEQSVFNKLIIMSWHLEKSTVLSSEKGPHFPITPKGTASDLAERMAFRHMVRAGTGGVEAS